MSSPQRQCQASEPVTDQRCLQNLISLLKKVTKLDPCRASLVPDCLLLYFIDIYSDCVKPRPIDQNILTQYIAALLSPTCCVRLATCCDVLRHVGCFWLKFETCQIFHATINT